MLKKNVYLTGLVLVGIIYFLILPKFIQGGDTAELVNASYNLFVPHPPGYPLFVWAEHIWTHLLPVSTIFWRASLLTSLFGLAALGFLTFPLRHRGFLAIIPALILGLNLEFLETSVLPDVFSLHALFISAFGYVFLFMEEGKKRSFLMPFLFFLSAANHHTTIFLFPCLLFGFLESRKSALKPYLSGLAFGIALCFCLYLTLFFFHPEHPMSWGFVTDFKMLVRHLLRVEYGTFKLAGNHNANGFEAFLFLLKTISPFVPVLVFSIFFIIKRRQLNTKLSSLIISFVLSLLFPFMMNISSIGVGAEILVRFHVMPLVLLSLILVYWLNHLELNKKNIFLLILCLLPILVINLINLPHNFGLRNDSVIEDYARTLYLEGIQKAPSVIIADTDTAFFGIRYIQSMEELNNQKTNVAVVTSPLFFHPWFSQKVSMMVPQFKLSGAENVFKERALSITDNIVKPNLDRMNFIMVRDFKDGDWYKVTFMKLGRLVEKGNGIFFENLEPIHSEVPRASGPQHFTKSYLFYQYAHYYLAKSVFFSNSNDEDAAKKSWEQAVEIVPYAYPAMANLCQISNQYKFCDPKALQEALERTKGFF